MSNNQESKMARYSRSERQELKTALESPAGVVITLLLAISFIGGFIWIAVGG